MDFILNLNKYLSEEFVSNLIDSLEKERTNSLILNINKISEKDFISLFPKVKKHPFLPYVFYYKKEDYDFGKSYLLTSGAYYIMDASSLITSSLLHIDENDLILDLCSAPGGKTISLLLYNKDKKFEVISNDISYARSLELSKNIERIGVGNVIVTNNDFSKIKNHFFETFDKIILDAPCSGSAMFRKNDLAKKDWSIEKVLELKKIQKSLLKDALFMLKKGGTLVYSTCSFSFEENEEVILETLNEVGGFSVLDIPLKNNFYQDTKTKIGIHLFPNLYEGEGQYIALIKKKGTSFKKVDDKPKKETPLMKEFNLNFNKEINFKNKIYFTNNPLNLTYLNLIRPGLEVVEFKNNIKVPSFHLAHFLSSNNSIQLDEKERDLYLHGEEIKKELNIPNGYYVVSYNLINLGFIKYSNGRLKNLYPKGLRH